MGLFRSRVAAGSRLIWYKVGSGTDRACRAVGATVHCSTARVPARSVPGRPVFRHGKCRTPPCSGTVRGGTRCRLRFCTEVLGFWPAAATSKNALEIFKMLPTPCKRHYTLWNTASSRRFRRALPPSARFGTRIADRIESCQIRQLTTLREHGPRLVAPPEANGCRRMGLME